jgi:CheY-like chemotaxis protein
MANHVSPPVVLVVEDNLINQKVVSSMLRLLDCDYLIAQNGVEALRVLHDKAVSLVLMDCCMPIMDGMEATVKIRDIAVQVRDHDVPIIAVTAYVSNEYRKQCLAAGMNDFIEKPINMHRLHAVIMRWITK